MRLIDADALMREFAEFVRASNNSDFADVPTWNDAVSLLGSAPTMEAEPIVRCKDCIHKPVWKMGRIDKFAEPPSYFNTFENFMAGKTAEDYTCPYLWDSEGYYEMPEDDFFCKFGEKR